MKFSGIVIEGDKKGREHGFPTANISNIEKVGVGIYAARVSVDNEIHNAAVYVGTPRPDLLEAHILDWNGDIYGKEISVLIVKKIREDFCEPDGQKLKEMITNDIKEIRKCLQE